MPAYKILYEDEALVVVDKTAGVLSIPDRFIADKPNLQEMLGDRYGQIWTVHRLDKGTSGLLVFAKTEEAHRDLSQQFEAGKVGKIYLALLRGNIAGEEGEIDRPIAVNKQRAGMMMVTNRGKKALTSWRLLDRFQHYSWVEVQLHTGRTHQIRVHFDAIGYPLAADPLYGRGEPVFLSRIKGPKAYRKAKDFEERPLLARPGLHAYRLSLTHPLTKEQMTWETEPPKDMRALLNQLRKWDK